MDTPLFYVCFLILMSGYGVESKKVDGTLTTTEVSLSIVVL